MTSKHSANAQRREGNVRKIRDRDEGTEICGIFVCNQQRFRVAFTFLWHCANINRAFDVSSWPCVLICLCFEPKFSLLFFSAIRLSFWFVLRRQWLLVAIMLHKTLLQRFWNRRFCSAKVYFISCFPLLRTESTVTSSMCCLLYVSVSPFNLSATRSILMKFCMSVTLSETSPKFHLYFNQFDVVCTVHHLTICI